MSKSTGTVLGLQTWLRSQKSEATSTFELLAKSMDGLELVGMWDHATVSVDAATWAELVCETATQDAEGRGVTTCYMLRHMRDDKSRGMTNLKRVVAVEKDENAVPAMDGSSSAIIARLFASLERAQAQVIESSKASIETQKAALLLLTQTYGALGRLQGENVSLHERTIELTAQAAKPDAGKPDAFRTMVEVMGPHVAAKAAEKLLPMLLAGLGDDEPSGTSQREPS